MDRERALATGAPDVHPEDRARMLLRLLPVLGDLDSARLASSADLHLRLDHARVADLLGRLDGALDGVGDPTFGYRNPVAGKELLSLVLEQIQDRERLSERRIGPSREAEAADKCKLP